MRGRHNYIAIVDMVTGRKLDWFFNVYLYQAELPKLASSRDGTTLTLQWVTPHDLPFPMPVEVKVGDTLVTVAMTGKRGTLGVKPGVPVTIDPQAKLLRQQPYVEACRKTSASRYERTLCRDSLKASSKRAPVAHRVGSYRRWPASRHARRRRWPASVRAERMSPHVAGMLHQFVTAALEVSAATLRGGRPKPGVYLPP